MENPNMSYETMTYRELLTAKVCLEDLDGFKKEEPAKRLTRHLLWVTGKVDEYSKAREALMDGHALRDENGNKIPSRAQDDSGEWVDVPGSVRMEDQAAWEAEHKKLLDTKVNLSGDKLTDADLFPPARKSIPEPRTLVGLGKLYTRGNEPELDEDND